MSLIHIENTTMGTRGLIVLKYKGKQLSLAKGLDSYPSALGVKILTFISEIVKEWNEEEFIALIIRLFEEYYDITPFNIDEAWKPIVDKLVDSESNKDPVISKLIQRSLLNFMGEYRYIINFDKRNLIVEGDMCSGEYSFIEEQIEDLILYFSR